MRTLCLLMSILIITCLMATHAALMAADGLPRPGQIAAEIATASNPSESYACFLPSSLRRGDQRPVLVLFSPGGGGRGAVRKYQAAAEAHGWIVIASNQSRNGRNPGPSIQALAAELASGRLPIDPERIYLGGMSGGARVSLMAATYDGWQVAGLIQAAAAQVNEIEPASALPADTVYVQLVGTTDYNFPEIMRFADELRRADRNTRTIDWNGGHGWAPEADATAAVRWCELQHVLAQEAPDTRQLRALVAAEVTDLEARYGPDSGRWYQRVMIVTELLAQIDDARTKRPLQRMHDADVALATHAADAAGWEALESHRPIPSDHPSEYKRSIDAWLAILDNHPNTDAARQARWALETCVQRLQQYAQAAPNLADKFNKQRTRITTELGRR